MITAFSRLYREIPDVGFHSRWAAHQIEEPTADELIEVILELIPYIDPNRPEEKRSQPWAGNAASALDNFVCEVDRSPAVPWATMDPCRKAAEVLRAWSFGYGAAPERRVLVAALERVAVVATEQSRDAEGLRDRVEQLELELDRRSDLIERLDNVAYDIQELRQNQRAQLDMMNRDLRSLAGDDEGENDAATDEDWNRLVTKLRDRLRGMPSTQEKRVESERTSWQRLMED